MGLFLCLVGEDEGVGVGGVGYGWVVVVGAIEVGVKKGCQTGSAPILVPLRGVG